LIFQVKNLRLQGVTKRVAQKTAAFFSKITTRCLSGFKNRDIKQLNVKNAIDWIEPFVIHAKRLHTLQFEENLQYSEVFQWRRRLLEHPKMILWSKFIQLKFRL